MKSKKGFFILLAVFLVLVVCYLALKVWTEKAQEEEQAKTEAEQIYLTELLVTHNGTEAEQFRYSVSDGGTLYLSGYAAGGEVWCRLANTPDGSYTEGLLLPFRQQYSMEICYGEEREEIALTLQEQAG